MSNTTMIGTCTVGPDAVTGERCGGEAVACFTGRDGTTYYECIEHAFYPVTPEHVAPAHPPTRSRRPYLLVRGSTIVGYADAHTLAVAKRARRLGAKVIPNPNT